MIKDALKIAQIHLNRLERTIEEMQNLGDLDNIDFEDFEIIKLIDTFIFRFMKLQDYMGNKLFKAFLITVGEYTDDMSFIDILDKLEKLRIINSTEEWLKIRKLRNKLAHEYPDEFEEIKQDIKEALKYVDFLKDAYVKIKNYLLERNLLET
jgi:uncharacterized protein YutE (UPF0331/DUF86 family)